MYVELLEVKYRIKKLEKWKKGLFSKYEKCLLDTGKEQVMFICKKTPFTLGSKITNLLCDEKTKNEIYDLYIKLYDDENRKGRKYIVFDIAKAICFIFMIIFFALGIKNFIGGEYFISTLFNLISILMPFMPVSIMKSFYRE